MSVWLLVELYRDPERTLDSAEAMRIAGTGLLQGTAQLQLRVFAWTLGAMAALLLCLGVIVARERRLRLHAGQERDASESRFRATFGQAAVGMIIFTPQLRRIAVNRRFCEIVGYSEAECLALPPASLMVPGDVPGMEQRIAELVEGKRTRYHIERQYLRKDGTRIWCSAWGHRFSGASGETLLISVVEDIDDRKRAELALRQWGDAFTHCTHGIAIGNPADATIQVCNPAFARMIGTAVDAIAGVPVVSVYDLRDRERVQALIAESDRVGQVGYEATMRRSDGSSFPAQMDMVSVRDAIGRPLYRVATMQDISERRQAEAALRESEERLHRAIEEIRSLNTDLERRVHERTAELEAANRELDSFAYAVSHDLRAPLRALNGFSQALAEDYGPRLDAGGLAFLAQIRKGSRNMADLIDGLLTLSRSTRGELRRDPVDLSQMAQSILAELRAAEPGREMRCEVEPGLMVRGDARMLASVLRNLLGNAWKYTGKTPAAVIRFHGEREGATQYHCVSDNGAGFDEAHASKLFQPFQRLHRQDEFPGIGIGLATVSRIVHRHGGKLQASGVPGAGARFCFSLPWHAGGAGESGA